MGYQASKSLDVAVKFIDLSHDGQASVMQDKLLDRELDAMKQLKHRYIVPVFDVFLSPDRLRVWILMKLAAGDLLQELDRVGHLTEGQARIWAGQVMQALQYMHSKRWAHRDLKAENILISFDRRAWLSDFGLSRQQEQVTLSETHVGSLQYMAPEVLDIRIAGRPYDGKTYDAFKADIWSLGILVFVMCTGHLPVNQVEESKLRMQQESIQDLLAPDSDIVQQLSLSPKLTDFLKQLLTTDPNKRVTLDQAVKHPWLWQDMHLTPVVRAESQPPPASPAPPPQDKPRIKSLISGIKRRSSTRSAAVFPQEGQPNTPTMSQMLKVWQNEDKKAQEDKKAAEDRQLQESKEKAKAKRKLGRKAERKARPRSPSPTDGDEDEDDRRRRRRQRGRHVVYRRISSSMEHMSRTSYLCLFICAAVIMTLLLVVCLFLAFMALK